MPLMASEERYSYQSEHERGLKNPVLVSTLLSLLPRWGHPSTTWN